MNSFVVLVAVVAVASAQELLPPANCLQWYDGCHTCDVVNGQIQSCTDENCFQMNDPECLRFDCADVACIDSWEPVCGSDFVTYGNRCVFENAHCRKSSLSIMHDGECPDVDPIEPVIDCSAVQICNKMYAPVCAANGVTYGNQCEFERTKCEGHLDDAGFRVVHPGACINGAPTACDQVMCPAVYNPVCASNGKTFSNRCEFRRVSCKTPGTLFIVSEGECAHEIENCDKVCPAVWQPVCGSNLVTYGNECELAVASCNSDVTIRSLHKGECVDGDRV